MTEDFDTIFENYQNELEKIICKEVPLREPSICVVHIRKKHIEEVYRTFIQMLKKMKTKYSDWNYKLFNIEETFFKILKEIGYLDDDNLVLECEREELSADLKGSVLIDIIKEIKNTISELKEYPQASEYPPFLILLNIHSTYSYIQTKDVISQIINKKGVFIIILYLEEDKTHKSEKQIYKKANYNVQTYYLI